MSDFSAGLIDTTETRAHRRSPALLFWILVGLPLGALIFSFAVAKSRLAAKYGDDIRITAERVVFESKNRPCDVVIFGDSTAQSGLDPAIIQANTHLSVCNVAVSGAVIRVLGMDPLDRFLANNPRPKVLLLQFATSDFQTMPDKNPGSAFADGFVLYLYYYGLKPALWMAVKHPDYFTLTMKYTFLYRGRQVARELVHWQGLPDPTQAYLKSMQPALTSCPEMPKGAFPVEVPWVQSLRTRYAGAAGRLLLNISPTMSCNPDLDEVRKKLAGITDKGVTLYPISDFVSDAHFAPAGVRRLSDETSQQILSAVAGH